MRLKNLKYCSFATADGKVAEESGYLKDVSIGKDGEPVGIQVSFIFNKN